jgi:hypothetical protein
MIKVSADFSGLERLQQKLRDFKGTHSVPMNDIFPSDFMREHTNFGSIDDMFAASGFKVETAEDLKAIPDDEWDAFVLRTTRFESWADMKQAGATLWTKRQLDF